MKSRPRHSRGSRTASQSSLEILTATYLDKLGTECAEEHSKRILLVIKVHGSPDALPLDPKEVSQLLDGTIFRLQSEGKVDWDRTPTARQQVFIKAWLDVMNHKGIA